MTKPVWIVLLAAALAAGPGLAKEQKKAVAKKKVETGASCKAPAVGRCAACSITCRPGETAQCSGGVMAGDLCHIQPACKCAK